MSTPVHITALIYNCSESDCSESDRSKSDYSNMISLITLYDKPDY